jgi:hypothetical protein
MNPEVRPEYWDQHSISVHGILPDDERIINAGYMRTVWPEFQCWFFSIMSPAKNECVAVSLQEFIITWIGILIYCASTDEESKSNCGDQKPS